MNEDERTPRFSEPGAACAGGASVHPSLPALCGVWSGDGLPPMAKRVLGRVILRLANNPKAVNQAMFERCQQLDEPGANPTAELRDRCERLAAQFEERRTELCHRLMDARVMIPIALAERCSGILPIPTATATSTAATTATNIAEARGDDALELCRQLLQARGQGNPHEVCHALLSGQSLPVQSQHGQQDGDRDEDGEQDGREEARREQQELARERREERADLAQEQRARDDDRDDGDDDEDSRESRDQQENRNRGRGSSGDQRNAR